MTDIDTMSGADLDALAATRHMGWHSEKGYWVDETGLVIATIFNWRPSSGKKLSAAASDVLLKALGEGWMVEAGKREDGLFWVRVSHGGFFAPEPCSAPTLPLALVRAICKAKEEAEADVARGTKEASDGK